jgi:PIN domain nuclease of toxin-antitoxin system
MKVLLDTHTFLWLDISPSMLSSASIEIIKNPNNELFVSIASLWEIQIKHQIGKLALQYSLKEMITMQQQVNQIQILPITFQHILTLETLPLFHKDPFDRLLISQAIAENIPIVSKDHNFHQYDVKHIW